jgi:hypothetical protein
MFGVVMYIYVYFLSKLGDILYVLFSICDIEISFQLKFKACLPWQNFVKYRYSNLINVCVVKTQDPKEL